MSFKKVMVVFRKELLEMLRDKRTLFATIVLPVIMYPLLFIGFSSIMSRQSAVLEERGAVIAIHDSVNTAVSAELMAKFQGIKGYTYLPINPETDKLFQENEIQAIISISDSLTASGLQTYRIRIKYDASKERNQLIYNKLKDKVAETERGTLISELHKRNVDPEIMRMIRIDAVDTSTAQKKMGMYLGMFLPYLMIIMLVAGAATVASDLVAGEKERRTLETLLVSGAHRNELVLGKYLTIITVAMVNVVVNLFSMGLSMQYMLGRGAMTSASVMMPIKGFVILLLAMIPLATLFASLLLSISTFSRNMKEAKSYEQPVLTISMLLGMISFFPAVEINNLLAMIPVVNIALLFKAVMINEYQISHLLITIISTLVLDVIAIWAAIKLFSTEAVLFRTDDESSLKNVRREKRNLFNSYYGLLYFTIALAAMYYLGSYLQGKDLMQGLMQTQFFIILLPVILILRGFKLNVNETLRFKLPKLKEAVLIPFIAIPAAILVSILAQVINTIFPFPEQYVEQLGNLFKMDASLWKMLLVIAVTPGICEEIMFRGFMIRFYEGGGTKLAILISALLFAVFHLDPFRFVPVFLLGILLGYLTLRSGSIVNSMISHTINNGLALLMVSYADSVWLKPLLRGADELHYWVAIPAAFILSAALMVFHKVTKPQEVIECVE